MSSATRSPRRKPSSSKSPQYANVPIKSLLAPRTAARQTMDERALEDLIDSIRNIGLIEPVVVEPEGDKYRILAGHRRWLACKALSMAEVPCVIRPQNGTAGEAVTVHENAFREDLNPAEEARYFAHLLETQCGGDVDRLTELVRVSRGYAEGRLLLLSGSPEVLEAVDSGRITLGVAKELNLVNDAGIRLVYLDAAIKGGASITLVREWRTKANVLYVDGPPPPPDTTPGERNALPPQQLDMGCFFCGEATHMYAMELLYLHRHCRQAINAVMMRKSEEHI
jgi:ParB family chromosome partitioning protein